jgi:hypothetical protein
MALDFTPEQLEEGICYFHGVGKASVSWWYRDHEIQITISNEYNTFGVEDDMGMKVFYEGTEITDKYIESMYEITRIRSTPLNIARMVQLIDENMDDYLMDTIKVKEGGAE